MEKEFLNIRFNNRVKPNSAFDFVKLEDLLGRKFSDHSIETLHKVEFFMLLFITEGEGRHVIDFTEYPYKKGTLLTIRKDQIHKFIGGQNVQGYLLLFTDDFLVSYLEKLETQKAMQLFNELLGVPKIQSSGVDYNTILNSIKRIEQEYINQFDDYSLGIIRSELHILVTQLFRLKSKSTSQLKDKKYLTEFIAFQQLVEAHVNRTKSVSEYARMMAVSTKTLTTISKSSINKTAKEFIDEIGIKQIKRLLINTNLSIKEIAYASGFEETTNFYKYFKHRVGMTPERFRSSF